MRHAFATSIIAAIAVTASGLAPSPVRAGTGASSAAWVDHGELDARIAAFTGQPLGTAGGAVAPVDRRLRLRRCAVEPEIGWHGRDRRALRLACPDPGGWRIFVPIRASDVTAVHRQAEPAVLVKRGEQVTISVTGPGFAVSRAGEALEEGAAGEWIRVRTARGDEPLRALVVRPGLVAIALR